MTVDSNLQPESKVASLTPHQVAAVGKREEKRKENGKGHFLKERGDSTGTSLTLTLGHENHPDIMIVLECSKEMKG